MTEQELARALIQSGRVTAQQVQEAAARRGPGRGIAHCLVELGLVSTEELLQLDPHAFEQAPASEPTATPGATMAPAPISPPVPTATPAPMTPPIPSPPPVAPPTPFSSTAAQPSPTAQVRMGAIGEAWKLAQQQMGIWVAAILITGILTIGISSAITTVLQSIPGFQPPAPDPNNPLDPKTLLGPNFFLVTIISSLFQVPISAFTTGGMLRMAINQLRTGTANIGDIFTVTDVFPALTGVYFVATLAIYIGGIFCLIPGLVLGGLLMLAMPIVADQRLGAGEALSLSWNTLKPHALTAGLFVFVALLASAVGLLLCCIGILFTSPIFYLAIAVVYRDFFPGQVVPVAAVTEPGSVPPGMPQPPTVR